MKERAAGTWLITGAASGLGREFARRLSAGGASLVLWDVNLEGLEQTRDAFCEPGTHLETVDVRDASAVNTAFERSCAVMGGIAHVIHCAGVLQIGSVDAMALDAHRRMMEINYFGSLHLARAVLPALRSQRAAATFMLVSSIASFRGFPEMSGYCASKFAVRGLAQAIRAEVTGTHVDVRLLCPPPIETPMVMDLPERPKIYDLSRLYTAEEVVTAALGALDGSRWLILVDARSKFLQHIDFWVPGVVDRVIGWARRR